MQLTNFPNKSTEKGTFSFMRLFWGAGIISVYEKAGRVSTGACELVELEAADEGIIFILNIFSIGVAIESG